MHVPILDHPRFRSPRALPLLLGLALTLLVLLANPVAASAGGEPVLSLSSTRTTAVPPNATTALAGVGVSGLPGTDPILVVVSASSGALTITTTSGLVLSPGSSWTGDPTVAFSGTVADVNAALATLTLTTGDTGGSTTRLGIGALNAPPGYAYSLETGHFYTYVPDEAISYSDATSDARALSFHGQPGYLASIASGGVNDLATGLIGSDRNVWVGAKSGTFSSADGYLVEFGDDALSATQWTGPVLASSDVAVVGAPAAPSNVTATPGAGKATITFTAPTRTRGSAITGYVVTTAPGGATTDCPGSPCEVTGLTNGDPYTFAVHTVTAADTSLESAATDPVTPAASPQKPTGVTVTPGDDAVTVAFAAPSDNGGAPVTEYTASALPGSHSASCSASPCVLPGLAKGTDYVVTVVAANAVGDSAATTGVSVRPVTVPDRPTNTDATSGNGSATVTFVTPDDNGGSPVTGYTVTSSPGGVTATCSSSPCVVTGLTNGTSHGFRVVANSLVGVSDPSSASDPVTPATSPDAVVGLTVVRADESAELSFDAPASDGGSAVTRYQVSLNGGDTWTDLTTSGSAPITATVTGLTNGTSYDLLVRAVNSIGAGPPSDPVGVTPARRPAKPTGVTATRGDGSALVAFTPPADNGSPVTEYTVISSPGGLTATCEASPCEVSGLVNGTEYTFTVTATNDVGTSADSDASNSVTPASAPHTPVLYDVRSAAGALRLSFSEPADGGSPILGYEVTTDDGDDWDPLTVSGAGTLTATVTGLDNGESYDVQVRALNSVGHSSRSNELSGTPATVPSAPRAVEVEVHNGGATVSWRAPSSDGGAPIGFYGVVALPSSSLCVTETDASCTFESLPSGVTYTFEVYAINTDDTKTGTGESPAATSDPTLVGTAPTAPDGLVVTPGDRELALAFEGPESDGGSPVTGYQVSLNGGDTWKTYPTTGASPMTVPVGGVRNRKSYRVQVRAVNLFGEGDGTASVPVTTASWFTDPVSPADRRKEVAVPEHPSSYRGPVRHTRATFRSRNATTAYPSALLDGRQLQSGEAADLSALFKPDTATLTSAGRAQIAATADSLDYVTAITCEGYTDYDGKAAEQKQLGLRRATAVCTALKADARQLTSRKLLTFGGTRPVTIGGLPADRAANRRVVVLIRK